MHQNNEYGEYLHPILKALSKIRKVSSTVQINKNEENSLESGSANSLLSAFGLKVIKNRPEIDLSETWEQLKAAQWIQLHLSIAEKLSGLADYKDDYYCSYIVQSLEALHKYAVFDEKVPAELAIQLIHVCFCYEPSTQKIMLCLIKWAMDRGTEAEKLILRQEINEDKELSRFFGEYKALS